MKANISPYRKADALEIYWAGGISQSGATRRIVGIECPLNVNYLPIWCKEDVVREELRKRGYSDRDQELNWQKAVETAKKSFKNIQLEPYHASYIDRERR